MGTLGKELFFGVIVVLIWGGSYALLNVALVDFVLLGNATPTSLRFSGACMDLAEEELQRKYGDMLNFTRFSIFERNVTTCDIMDRKASFWAARYYYKEMRGSPVFGLFGPGERALFLCNQRSFLESGFFRLTGCPTAAASVGHLARGKLVSDARMV